MLRFLFFSLNLKGVRSSKDPLKFGSSVALIDKLLKRRYNARSNYPQENILRDSNMKSVAAWSVPFLFIAVFGFIVFHMNEVDASTSFSSSEHLQELADARISESIHSHMGLYSTGISHDDELALANAIVEQSRVYGIDPYLVMAVIKTESTFNSRARSNKGAMGIMQILPSTAKEVAGDLGMEWKGHEMLYNPSVNVTLGIHYLSFLRGRFDNDMTKAIVAYNRGPYKLARSLRKGKHLRSAYADKVYSNYKDFKGSLAFN